MKVAIYSALVMFWVSVFLFHPALTYRQGTSADITVEVLKAPDTSDTTLIYRWTGNIERSCEISLRRTVVDSVGEIHVLVSTPILPSLPRDQLGLQSSIIETRLPRGIPSGPAEYRVREVPRCTWLQRVWPVAVDYPPVRFEMGQ